MPVSRDETRTPTAATAPPALATLPMVAVLVVIAVLVDMAVSLMPAVALTGAQAPPVPTSSMPIGEVRHKTDTLATKDWPGPNCPKIATVVARGSGEAPQGGAGLAKYSKATDWGMGSPGAATAAAITDIAHDQQLTAGREGVLYPAEEVATILRNAERYQNSIASGADAIIAQLRIRARPVCDPTPAINLVGYSQGAWSVRVAVLRLARSDPALLEHIGGIVLIGDPAYDSSESIVRGSKPPVRRFGVAHAHALRGTPNWWLDPFPQPVVGRTSSFCIAPDIVCRPAVETLLAGFGPFSAAIIAGYLTHTRYTRSEVPRKAARWLGKFLPPRITTATLPPAHIDAPYRARLRTADGRDGSWIIDPGDLPAGLELDSRTGMIAGTPTGPAEVRNVPVTFRDTRGLIAKAQLRMTLLSAPPDGAGPWVSIDSSGSSHSCGLDRSAHLWCWGWNASGLLGNGTLDSSPVPTRVVGAGQWQSVSVSTGSACALKIEGSVWCWGAWLTDEADSDPRAAEPFQIGGSTNWVSVNVGADSTCAIKSDSTLWCWGMYIADERLDGTVANSWITPHRVGAGRGWSSVSVAAAGHICALATEGSVWCWDATTSANWATAPPRGEPAPSRSAPAPTGSTSVPAQTTPADSAPTRPSGAGAATTAASWATAPTLTASSRHLPTVAPAGGHLSRPTVA